MSTHSFLETQLGRRISTRTLATYLGLDEDVVRQHYEAFGGIRPTGPKGRILFFERNVTQALKKGEQNGIEEIEKRTYPLAGASSAGRTDQVQDLSHQSGSAGMGGRNAGQELGGDDRHGLLAAGLGEQVS